MKTAREEVPPAEMKSKYELQSDRLAGLLAELEKEHGPIPLELMEEVRREWLSPGDTNEP